jgi:hypothetical protein
MVLWMSALVSRLIMRFMTWLTVASRPSASMYRVFSWARIL